MSQRSDGIPDLSQVVKAPAPTSIPLAGQVTSEKVTRARAADAPERTEEERKRIDQVKKVMFDLAKTVRSYTLYSQNNDAIRQFVESLYAGLTAFLEHETVLNLRVRPDAMHYLEEMVYENSNREESIAMKLYKDGVKELVFQRGLEKQELLDFIDILNLNLDQPEYFDEDVVSLMWQRDFENISYFVIEGFTEDLEPAKREQIEEDIEMILSLVHAEAPPERALKSAHLSKDDLYQFFKRDELDSLAEEALGELDDFRKHFLVDEADLQKLRREAESLSDAEVIFQMIDIILNILARETEHESFRTIGDVLVQILDMLLLRSDFSNATKIIKRLRQLVISSGRPGINAAGSDGSSAIVDNQFHGGVRMGAWIEEIIERIGEEQRVAQLVTAFNQGFKGKPSEIFDYVISLNASAVTPLVNILGEVSNLTHRRLICDAVLIIHDGDITKFAQKLYDERWFVVSDMLYILGKLGSADALDYMVKATEHENPKVRTEALGALRRFPMEKVRGCYIRALQDDNLQVQMVALRALAQTKDHGAVDQILEIIESQDFLDFPLSVKRRFFMTLAMIEGADMVDYFAKILKRNRFWLGSINIDMRSSAAFALGLCGTSKAVELLKTYENAFNRDLRQACREALQRSKGGSAQSGGNLILEPIEESSSGVLPIAKPASAMSKGSFDLILEPIREPPRKK